MKIVGPRLIDPITKVLQFLYAPPVLIPVLITITIAQGWLYFVHGVARSIRDVLFIPGGLLIALAILLIGGVFHEFGHASALRYGGGKVRGMGAGIYLVYLAFYTDVTDSYRLGRWARVRTDLGGFYFSLIFTLGIMALSLISGQEFLLSIVVLIDLDIIFQSMPFVRFDGYWALADLTGIPDFFSQIGPFLASVLPIPAGKGRKLPNLKPWVKRVFASYIIVTIFVLVLLLSLTVIYTPPMVLTTWDALLAQRDLFVLALGKNDFLGMVLSVVQELILSLPLWATLYMFYLLGRGPLRALWNWSKLTPKRRIGSGLGAAGTIALVAFLWMPQLSSLFWPMQSKAVDGIPCDQGMYVTEHMHADLAIYVKGQAVSVPQGIGIPAGGNCLYWLHTHRTDGVIHVESPKPGSYTLGQFMDIWGHTKQRAVLTDSSFLGYPLKGHQLVIWASINGQIVASTPTSVPTTRSSVAKPYTGTIHDIPANVTTNMSLTVVQQQQGNISGYFTGLDGNGPFKGTITPAKHIQFTVIGNAGQATLSFDGSMQPDGTIGGTYCRQDQAGKCSDYGIWSVSPAASEQSSFVPRATPRQDYIGNLRNLVLQSHEIITIAYDSPQARPITHFGWENSSAGG